MRVRRTSALREFGLKTELTPNLLQTAVFEARGEELCILTGSHDLGIGTFISPIAGCLGASLFRFDAGSRQTGTICPGSSAARLFSPIALCLGASRFRY